MTTIFVDLHRDEPKTYGQWITFLAVIEDLTRQERGTYQRCGRPFQTDVIRALCGACQRAQEVAG